MAQYLFCKFDKVTFLSSNVERLPFSRTHGVDVGLELDILHVVVLVSLLSLERRCEWVVVLVTVPVTQTATLASHPADSRVSPLTRRLLMIMSCLLSTWLSTYLLSCLLLTIMSMPPRFGQTIMFSVLSMTTGARPGRVKLTRTVLEPVSSAAMISLSRAVRTVRPPSVRARLQISV